MLRNETEYGRQGTQHNTLGNRYQAFLIASARIHSQLLDTRNVKLVREVFSARCDWTITTT